MPKCLVTFVMSRYYVVIRSVFQTQTENMQRQFAHTKIFSTGTNVSGILEEGMDDKCWYGR